MPYVAIRPYPEPQAAELAAAYRGAHKRLHTRFPWAAAIVTQLEKVYAPIGEGSIAGTDGLRLILTQGFLDLDEETRAAVLAHEAEHIVLGHVDRMPPDAPLDRWNVAADLALNPILRADGWVLPGRECTFDEMLAGATGHLFDARYDGWNAERILRALPPDPPPPEPEDQDQDQDQSDASSPVSEPDEDQPAATEPSKQQDPPENEPDENGASSPENEPEDQNQEPQDNATPGEDPGGPEETEADADTGDTPGGLEAGIAPGLGGILAPPPTLTADEHRQRVAAIMGAAQLLAPPPSPDQANRLRRTDWRTAVADWLAPVSGSALDDWTRPNRRTAHLGNRCYLPSHTAPTRKRRVMLYLDTSGSMVSHGRLGDAIGALRDACEALDDTDLTVAAFDTGVHWTSPPVEPGITIDPPISGGGTDFRPIFEHAAEHAPAGAAVVVHTDLAGPMPEDPGAKYPTLWLRWSGRYEPPFGELLEC